MLKNKSVIIISVLVVVSVVAVIVLMFNTEKGQKNTPAINAVPINAGVIISIPEPVSFIKSLNKTDAWNEINNISGLSYMPVYSDFIDSLINSDPKIVHLLTDKTLIISLHKTGKRKSDFLFTINPLYKSDLDYIKEFIMSYLDDKSKITVHKYDGTPVFKITLNSKNNKFIKELFFAADNGTLLFSKNSILIESSIRQLHKATSLMYDNSFKKVASTVGKNAKANIFVNYAELKNVLSPITNNYAYPYLKKTSEFTSWSAFDLFVDKNGINLAGFSLASTETNSYLNIFKNLNANKYKCFDIFPVNTASFFAINVDNTIKLFKNHSIFLKNKTLYHKKIDIFKNIFKNSKISVEKDIIPFLSGEAASITVDFTRRSQKYDRFVVIGMKESEKVKSAFQQIIDNYQNKNIRQINSDNKTFEVYEFPEPEFFGFIFGNNFNLKKSYMFFYKNYIVLSENIENLENYLASVTSGQTLANSILFNKFKQKISDAANVFIYYDMSLINGKLQNYLTYKYKKILNKNINSFNKYRTIGIQYNYTQNMFYSNVYVEYNKTYEAGASLSWEINLDTAAVTKPFMVRNHYTGKHEIFVQDAMNKIYLIDAKGNILFEKVLSSPIIGQVHQIDYYNNGKLQYLFNTENFIHLIDRNGNYVENYPVKLPCKASAPLSVFDYDNDKEYRIFVPCKNGKIYLFRKDGSINEGWKFDKCEFAVESPVSFFRIKEKDYIVFADKLKVYITNRKGQTRVTPETNFPKSPNSAFTLDYDENNTPRLVTTNLSGMVFYIYFDGKVRQKKINTYSHKHYFNYIDLDGDGKKEYVYADHNKLDVYTCDYKNKFSFYVKGEISQSPVFYTFSKNDIKIGLVDQSKNELWLINNDGTKYPGFPLKGYTKFSIGLLDNNTKFSLVCGYSGKNLLNYWLN